MSIITIRSALEVELNAMSPALSTQWENDEYTPVVGTSYQRARLLLATPDDIEFGPVFRQPGVFEITLFYPLKEGPTAAATRAELIRSTFKRGISYINVPTSLLAMVPQDSAYTFLLSTNQFC